VAQGAEEKEAEMKSNATQSSADSISNFNKWKILMRTASHGLPVTEFRPLSSWPVARHPEQARIDAINAIPSRFS